MCNTVTRCTFVAALAVAALGPGCNCDNGRTDGGPGTDSGVGTDGGGAIDSAVGADSGADSGPGTDAATSSVAQAFCDAIAPGYCEVVFSCCDVATMMMWGTQAQCEMDFPALCASDFDVVDARSAAGMTVYDPAGAAACAAGLAALAGTCDEFAIVFFLFECVPASFVGTVPAGGTCMPLGSDLPSVQCEPGHYCSDDTGLCAAFQSMGDPCSDTLWCDWGSGQRCVLDNVSGLQSCAPGLADGTPCTDDLECASFNCPGALCEGVPPGGVCEG